MLEILIKSIKDLFDKKILFKSLVPIIVAAIFWGIVFFVFHSQINDFFVYLISHIPFISDSNWIKNIIEVIGGIFIYYQLLIITSTLIVGVIADKIVDRINEKYYHLKKQGFGSFIGSIGITLKYNLIFIILFIILLPAMFIPGINIIVNIMLWIILIKNPIFYDSIAMYASKEEYQILKNNKKTTTFIIAFLSALLFLVPILGVFVYIAQLLLFTHYNLKRLKELRGE